MDTDADEDFRKNFLANASELLSLKAALDSGTEKYTAVVIEPRRHKALPFLLKNLLENLSLDWSIKVFHGQENSEWFHELLKEFGPTDRVRITSVPMLVRNFENSRTYSEFVASREFLAQIHTETFLIAQTDSMINPNQKGLLQKFLQYDYVGAPWPWDHLHVGNGGFSLRKRSAMLRILDRVGPLQGDYEDQFFATAARVLKLKVPTREQAREFAVEQIYSPKFFGVHRVWDHLSTRYDDLCDLCPGLETLRSLQPMQPMHSAQSED